ncbi:MAG: 3-hexulose-6-phosphate synthase [Planctomycetota bacterium]|jgi:3-hexulose-6-phosphate synthase/6-phospho-3-hexuloisomerase
MAQLQVALDFVDTARALKCAREAVDGGADILEVGTPLLKAEGLDAVRALHREFPDVLLVCDGKTMDAGRAEFEIASKAGAKRATVLGVASDATIRECVEAGRNYGIEVYVDLLGHPDPVERAKQAAELGACCVGVHCPIDEQMEGLDPFERLRAVASAVDIPVAVAGGITAETAAEAVKAGASVVIVGGFISKASDGAAAARAVKTAMETGVGEASEMFRRVSGDDLREILEKVSTPNVSDGFHRQPCLDGITAVTPGAQCAGPAFTVRTAPGDWAKPVEAIDEAPEGSVLVIEAGGVPPALWGELATHSCIQRKIAGVVIDGAIRDTPEIRRLGFPAWAKHVVAHAGEPRGFGEMGVTVRMSGQSVSPGDWIVADDDGVIVLPRERAAEMANRAMDCLEKEMRIRHEIDDEGRTLNEVVELYKWEKDR